MPDDPDRNTHEAALVAILLLWQKESRVDLLERIRAEQAVAESYWRREQERLMIELRPRLQVVAHRAGVATATQLGYETSPIEQILSSARTADVQSRRYADWIVDAVKENYERDIDDVIIGGLSVNDLLDDAYKQYKAARDAISMTTDTITGAETDTAKRIQQYVQRERVLTGNTIRTVAVWRIEDDNACKICKPLDGVMEDFWPEEQKLGPTAHPSCRCYLTWHMMIDGVIQPLPLA